MTVTIVTGASTGIGKSIANYILSSSSTSKVFLTARTEKPLADFVQEFGSARVGYFVGDISEKQTPSAIVSKTIEKFGAIDAIVANAGMLEPVESVQQVKIDNWKKLFDVNYFSVVDLVSQALPYLKQTNGSIILVSSGASTKSYYGWTAYGGSKAAINHFAICVASEVPEVRIVSVAPGVVDTSMQTSIREVYGKNMTPQSLQRFIDLKANNQLLDPHFVGKIYGNLALKGVSEELNGKYVRYNDKLLKSYTE